MTVIAAIVDGNVCVFSSDSGAFSDDSVSLRKGSKVFNKRIEGAGECLVGFAGTFAICQWIKFLEFPECPVTVNCIEEYLVTILQPFLQMSIQKRWKKVAEVEANVDVRDYQLLLGMHGCLYTLYSNGDVEKAQAFEGMLCFASIGSAGDIANAAMFAIQPCAMRSWEILEVGMKNALQFSLHVRAPFDVRYLF
jgi:ATP-dependent protease HslVU (ClpYQ) peptidase subunit